MNPQNTYSPGLISVDQFRQSDLANQPPSVIQQATASAPPPAAHAGNWLTHLLPTAGGILGSIGGGILTAGLGGEVAGGAGGAALGKTLENAMEGQSAIQGNDVTAGLEGGIGAGVGGIAGKALGKVGEALGGRAASVTGKQAAQDAINTAANTYKDVNPTLQGNLGGRALLQKSTDLGYTSAPEDLAHISNTSNDILNDVLNGSLNKAGPVDLSNYNDLVKTAINKVDPNGNVLGSYDKVAIAKGKLQPANTPAAKLVAQLENLGAGVAKTHSDPNELRTLTTNLFNAAQDAKPMPTASTGAVDPAQRSVYNAINEVRNQVKDVLYNRPEVKQALSAAEANIAPDEAARITPQLAEHLNGVIGKAGQNGAQDLLDEISNNIDMNTLGKEGGKASQIISSTGAQARQAADAGLTGGAGTPSNLDAAQTVLNAGHPVTSALKGAMHAKDNPAILNALSRIGGLGAKLAPAAGVTAATAANMGAAPVGGAPLPGAANGTMGAAMQQPGQSPLDQLYQTLLDNYNASAGVTPNDAAIAQTLGGLAPQVQKNNLIATELSGLPSLYANAGGAQGIGGVLSQISGLVPGTAANRYQSVMHSEAPQLQQLGINPALLPTLMSNQPTAGVSQGILNQLQGQLAY